MDFSFYIIVAVTFFGFVGLAFVLLYPVYRFMSKEEKIADEWTPDAIARRQLRTHAPGSAGGDGATASAGGPGGRGAPPTAPTASDPAPSGPAKSGPAKSGPAPSDPTFPDA